MDSGRSHRLQRKVIRAEGPKDGGRREQARKVRCQWPEMQNREKEVRDLLLLETQSQVPGTW